MKYVLSVFLGAASYGILSTFVVLAYGAGYGLGEVVGSQLLTGFLLASGLAWFTKRREKRGERNAASHPHNPPAVHTALTWKHKLLLMAAGTSTAATGLVYYESLRYIPASLAIVLLFQFTWISILVQAVRERKRPSKAMLGAVAVLLGGTLLATGISEHGFGRFELAGVIWGLLSAVSYSVLILVTGKVVPSAHPAYRSLWMIAGGLALVLLLFIPKFVAGGITLGWDLMLYGFLLGLFGAFIPPVLFAIGVPRIGEGMTGILGASELPVAVLMSSVVLNEYVSLLQWAGVVVVLIGVSVPELAARCGKMVKKAKLEGRGYEHRIESEEIRQTSRHV